MYPSSRACITVLGLLLFSDFPPDDLASLGDDFQIVNRRHVGKREGVKRFDRLLGRIAEHMLTSTLATGQR